MLDVGMLNDDTKVLCEAWPFQQAGLPIWLRYVETFTSGGERVKEQFVGAAHDQEGGLDYLAEVEWLRGCKADSKLAVVLKVGLHAGAVETDAVACRVRSYGVKAGLDDLTTFEDYDWNHWSLSSAPHHSRITLLSGEYVLEALPLPTVNYRKIYITKPFQRIETGTELELSFDYIVPVTLSVTVDQNLSKQFEEIPRATSWQTKIFRFSVAKSSTPRSLMLCLQMTSHNETGPTYLKNIRVKEI